MILFIFNPLMLPFLLYAQDSDNRFITVMGNAEVRVVPDEVVLTLGVETRNIDLKKAKQENDSIVQNIFKVAIDQGIKEEHIQTDLFDIEPKYRDYDWEKEEFIGYFVRKSIVLTLRDISKFEDLLSKALEAGANFVHGINFRTTELRKHKDKARSLAIKAAKEKAIALAKDLGQEIGKPHDINENSSGWWSDYRSWWGSRWHGGMSQNVIQNMGMADPLESNGTIALGQININANVTVSFELK